MLPYDEKNASSTERAHDYTSRTPSGSQSTTITEISGEPTSNGLGTEHHPRHAETSPDLECKAPQELQPVDEGRTLSPDEVPDGGIVAWLQVLGSWVIAVDTWGVVNSYGVFQTYYGRELLAGRSASDLSWVGSLQAALLMIIGPIAGPAYDSGYFRQLLWAGLSLIILGQFMTSLCETYWQVVMAQGVCVGVGCGLVFLPSQAILSQYFKRRRALAIGIASTGSPVASMIFPVIFGQLQPKIGFPWTTRILAFVMLALSTVPVIFMRMRVPPPGRVRSLIDKKALRDVPFLLFCCGVFLSFMTIYVGFFYIQNFAIRFGITSADFSPYLVTLLGAGSIFGRIGPNYLADKYGAINVLILAGFASGVLCFGWMGIHNMGGIVAFAVLYGVTSGGLVSVTPSATVSLTPDLTKVGTRLGMQFFGTGIAAVVGPPIAGVIIGEGEREGWLGAIGFSAAGLTLGSMVLAASRFTQYGRTQSLRG